LKRLNGGLFTLQLIDYIILEVCNSGPNVKKRVTNILNMRGDTLKTIRQIMRGIMKILIKLLLLILDKIINKWMFADKCFNEL